MTRPHSTRAKALFAALLLALPWLAACGTEPAADVAAAPTQATPIPVLTTSVRMEDVVEPIFGTGTIVADKTTELGPLVPGVIETIHVQEGDAVEAGQPLFTTREVDYRIGREEATHAARLAEAQAEKAKRDLERAGQLRTQGVASQGHLDDAHTAHEIATAQSDVARAALARARQNLADTSVRAPYAGVITRRYVDEGVRMGGMAGPGAVVQLMKVDVVEAVVQVPELHVGALHEGMKARVRLDGTGGVFDATVGRVNPKADPASRAIEVRIPIQNPEGALRPGLFAKAELSPTPRPARVIERSAVLGAGERRYVYQAVDGSARRRSVKVRELDALRVEILEGLEEGERAIAGPNLPNVAEGAPVMVEVARATP